MTSLNRRRLFHRLLSASALMLALGVAHAQTGLVAPTEAGSATSAYEPKHGQAGKDVVWIPTPQALVDEMLRERRTDPDGGRRVGE